MTNQNKYLIAGGSLLTLVAGYFLFFKTDNGGGAEDPTGNGTATAGNTTFNAGKTATALLNAMKEMNFSEETKIISLLKTVTPAQFELVFKAFGTHQYNSTLGNQINPMAWFSELPFVNLQGWLESELSEAEYANLANKYPNRL